MFGDSGLGEEGGGEISRRNCWFFFLFFLSFFRDLEEKSSMDGRVHVYRRTAGRSPQILCSAIIGRMEDPGVPLSALAADH